MAIQGSQDLTNIHFRSQEGISKTRKADYDAFDDVSNTQVLGDMPSLPFGNTYKCENVNALSGLTLEDGDVVELLGYYTEADGGSGSTLYVKEGNGTTGWRAK